jgi:hypothetical protein
MSAERPDWWTPEYEQAALEGVADNWRMRTARLYSKLDARDRDKAEWRISTDVVADMRRSVGAYGKTRPGDVQMCFGIPIRETEDAPPRTIELWKRIGS